MIRDVSLDSCHPGASGDEGRVVEGFDWIYKSDCTPEGTDTYDSTIGEDRRISHQGSYRCRKISRTSWELVESHKFSIEKCFNGSKDLNDKYKPLAQLIEDYLIDLVTLVNEQCNDIEIVRGEQFPVHQIESDSRGLEFDLMFKLKAHAVGSHNWGSYITENKIFYDDKYATPVVVLCEQEEFDNFKHCIRFIDREACSFWPN